MLDPADVMGLDYPSETLRVIKNGEMKAYGEYLGQRLVLSAWDDLYSKEIPMLCQERTSQEKM